MKSQQTIISFQEAERFNRTVRFLLKLPSEMAVRRITIKRRGFSVKKTSNCDQLCKWLWYKILYLKFLCIIKIVLRTWLKIACFEFKCHFRNMKETKTNICNQILGFSSYFFQLLLCSGNTVIYINKNSLLKNRVTEYKVWLK